MARARGREAGKPAVAVTNLLGDLGPVSAAPTPAPTGTVSGRGREGGIQVGSSGGQQARRVTAGEGKPARARPGRLTHRAPPGRPYAAGSAGAASPPCQLGSSPGPGTRTCSWSGFPAWSRPAGAGNPRAGGASEQESEAEGPASRPAPAASVRAALSGRDAPAPQRRHVATRHVTT